MLKVLLALLCLISLRLDAADIDVERFTADAKAALLRNYKDPESAQIRGTYVIRWDDKGREVYSLCGEINAKNSFGAYVGFRPFFVDRLQSGRLSASSALTAENPAITSLQEQFALDHCAGRIRPVQRLN